MKLQDLAKLIETKLDQIEERVIAVDGRIAEVNQKQVWANLTSGKIESQLTSLAGRMTGVEDQIRQARKESQPQRPAHRKSTTGRAGPSR